MDKKSETKRLSIYLAFAFGLTFAVFLPYVLSGHVWMKDGTLSGMDQFVCLGMLMPASAVLLTRYITKEGFNVTGKDSMLLGISFKGGKWIYFMLAIVLPWIYLELGFSLTLLLSPKAFDTAYPTVLGIADRERAVIFFQPLAMMVSGAIASFAAFGEEAGWRGYMMPKMIKLWGVKKAVILGGIIWGMWHWPLTYIGHNFGRDYFGYPFTGFGAMCILCIFMNMAFTFLTYKSGSIWPAVFLHAVGNSTPSIIQYFINRDKITGWKGDSVVTFLIQFLPMMVIAAFMFRKLPGCDEVKMNA